ncbi:hypothetical protein ABID95_004299 [Streptomyces atratus]
MGVFLAILNAKAESAGREMMAVDPRNTSLAVSRMRAHRQGEPAHSGEIPLRLVRPLAHADTVGALNVLRAWLARRDANQA